MPYGLRKQRWQKIKRRTESAIVHPERWPAKSMLPVVHLADNAHGFIYRNGFTMENIVIHEYWNRERPIARFESLKKMIQAGWVVPG